MFGRKKQENEQETSGQQDTIITTNSDLKSQIRAVIPVGTDSGRSLIQELRSRIDTALASFKSDIKGEDDIMTILDMSYSAIQPFLTESGIAVSTSPEGFKLDVKRKLVGMAEILEKILKKNMMICVESLNAVIENDMEKAERILSMITKEFKEKDKMSYIKEKVIDEYCGKSINLGMLSFVAYLVAIDWVLGAIQINFPAGIMPNAHKIRLGILTD